VNQHAEEHWMASMFGGGGGGGGPESAHNCAISHSDLNVWCYACGSYVKHDLLLPLLVKIAANKFDKEVENAALLANAERLFETGFVSPSAEMDKHKFGGTHLAFERPQRTEHALAGAYKFQTRMRPYAVVPATPEDLALVHEAAYISFVLRPSEEEAATLAGQADLFYTAHETPAAASAAAGGALTLLDKVAKGEIKRGFALVRPPGHHAGRSSASGFCFFNNVAVAAQAAIDRYGMKRVMIVDFDIHHGNGAQEIFYESPNVLTLSIHRQHFSLSAEAELANAEFSEMGRSQMVGKGAGAGFNINVALGEGDKEGRGLGDIDYEFIFEQVVLPVAREFRPEMIFIAAGFDAGISDRHLPVGGYSLTPSCYANMTTALMNVVADGKVIATMEGGYDGQGLCNSVQEVLRAMIAFANPSPPLPLLVRMGDEEIHPDTFAAVEQVKALHAQYWTCLAPEAQSAGSVGGGSSEGKAAKSE